MKKIKIDKNYLLLRNWWENLELTTYEKSILNKEIISFNQQLIRFKEKKIRIGVFGKSGVGKSYILNLLLNRKVFKTDIINGSTKKIQIEEWNMQHQTLRSIELLDSPGFDTCNKIFQEDAYSQIDDSELILFIVAGDLNRNELSNINTFIKNGKKIIIVLNKIDIWNNNELKKIIQNIKSKLPKELQIPVIINSKDNLQDYIKKIINLYGGILLTLNSMQLADNLFLKLKENRFKKRQREAQSTIGRFATFKASAVAINPLIFIDLAGSFALDTLLIKELSKVYGLALKGKSARKVIRNISMNNFFLGATQLGINTSFNLIRKVFLLSAPFTHGLSLLPYGPIAFIQAAIAVYSTKILGKLAAKEIFTRSKVGCLEPYYVIQKLILNEPDFFTHINIYLSKRNLNKNLGIFLP